MKTSRLHGLRGRFLLLVVTIFLGVGALAAYGFLRVADNIIHSLGAGYATQFANQSRGRILAKIQRELVLAQKLVDSPLLRRWSQDETNPELTRLALAELDSYRKLFDDHSYFFAIDASRNYYFNNASNEFAGKELRYQIRPDDPTMAWYFATMEHVENFDLHVDNSAQLGVTKVWINAIVRGDDGRKVGLGGSGLDLSAFLKDIVRATDAGVETWLVDAQGFLQGHPNPALMQANALIRDETQRKTVFTLLDDEADRITLRKTLQQMAVAGAAPNAQIELRVDGRSRLAAISYLPEIHWATVVLVDPAEVVRLTTFRPILILLAMALLATILLVSWLLNRLVLTRLARLSGHTRDVAAGQYAVTLPVDRADEIGQLTQSFNHMTTTISDYMQNLEHKVTSRTHDLQQANALLETSNRKIMDSIEYARLIQNSLLARPHELQRVLHETVVLWLPRDVVGGDFYALYPDDHGGGLLAVGDCTGHGVPGAFMTMATKALLDRAVDSLGMDDPGALIGALNQGLRTLLQQGHAGETENGLDLALLRIRPQHDTLLFAGAKLGLWVVEPDGQITTFKGDRYSVGYRKSPPDGRYANQPVTRVAGQRFYLFTDGILDQNGGARGVALGRSRLGEALQDGRTRPLALQAEALSSLLREWRGDLPQRDDITVLGFCLDPHPQT